MKLAMANTLDVPRGERDREAIAEARVGEKGGSIKTGSQVWHK